MEEAREVLVRRNADLAREYDSRESQVNTFINRRGNKRIQNCMMS